MLECNNTFRGFDPAAENKAARLLSLLLLPRGAGSYFFFSSEGT